MKYQTTLNPTLVDRKSTDKKLEKKDANEQHKQSHSSFINHECLTNAQPAHRTLSDRYDVRCIYRLPKVLIVTGLGRSTIYSRIEQGLFVPPISLGGRAVGWPSNEVDQLLQAMICGVSNHALKTLVDCLVSSRKNSLTFHMQEG